mgnify:CR=1 FL=1
MSSVARARSTAFFITGTLLWVNRERIRLSGWAVLALVAMFAALRGTGWSHLPYFGLLTYGTLWLGLRARLPMIRHTDLSYGLYLWHEILDWTIGHKLGSTGLRGLAVGSCSAVLAVGAAVLSKRYVEDPFLRRKQRFERTALPGTSASEGAGVRR